MNSGEEAMPGATVFRTLSAALTGFDENELDIAIAGEFEQRIAHAFPDTPSNKRGKRAYSDLMAAFGAIANSPNLKTALQGMLDANPSLSTVVSRIVLLWYMSQFVRDDGSTDAPQSEAQYKAGLVWRAIGAVPLGYSDRKLGYWGDPPNPLPKV